MKRFKMTKHGALLAAMVLSACAQQQVAEDTTPKNPTAVLDTRTTNLGFKGQFASEAKLTTQTRADMQRIDTEHEFTGAIMKHLVSGTSQAHITRLDKNLLWDLDKKEKSYTECPLGGCGVKPGVMALPQGGESRPDTSKEESCPLKMVKNEFDVKETGQTRVINGFDTREYLLAWDVVAEDAQKRQAINRLTVNVWTTPESDAIKSVLTTQATFEKAYLSKVASEYAGLQRVMPQEALAIVSNYFFSTLSETDRKALLGVGSKLDRVKGFPISTKIEWYASGEACAAPKSKEDKKEAKLDLKSGVGGLMNSLAGKLMDDKINKEVEQSKDKPVFGFVQEVKAIKMESVHDSVMSVPAGYKMVNRK